MTTIHKPTSEEKKIIRACAQRDSGFKNVEINPSTKISLTNPALEPAMNICFVSDDPDFGDTDLFDNAYSWRDFTKGFPLKDGNAIIDFYVYNIGRDPELQTNVTAYWKADKLVRVDGTGQDKLYESN